MVMAVRLRRQCSQDRRILERFQTQGSSQHSQFRFFHWLPLPQLARLRLAVYPPWPLYTLLCLNHCGSFVLILRFRICESLLPQVSTRLTSTICGIVSPLTRRKCPARQRLHYTHQYLPSLILEPCIENIQTLWIDWTSKCTLWNQKYTFYSKNEMKPNSA